MSADAQKIIIIAGPNGAGKTTFARSFLPASRVRQGGHNIPQGVIRRRFAAGLRNFHGHYRHAVNDWVLYDNAGDEPALLEWGENQ